MSKTLQEYLESLPQWQHEGQARSLLGSFSQPRHVNPEAWDARYGFWRDIILEGTRQKYFGASCLQIYNPRNLPALLSRQQISPLGLNSVLHQMKRDQLIKHGPSSAGPESLILRLARLTIARPLAAGWKMIAGQEDGEDLAGEGPPLEGPLTLVPLLEEISKDTLSVAANNPSILLTWEDFQDFVNRGRKERSLPPVTEQEDFELIKNHLQSRGLLAVRMDETSTLLALRFKSEKDKRVAEITREHLNVVRLRMILKDLEFQLSKFSENIDRLKESTRLALQRQDKALALHELKRCKLFEQARNQRLESFMTIQSIVLKIEASQTDAQVLKAYQLGEETLRKMLRDHGITAQGADNIILSLQEAMADHDQIAATLAMPFAEVVVEDAELEETLQKFISESGPMVTRAETTPEVAPELPLNQPESRLQEKYQPLME